MNKLANIINSMSEQELKLIQKDLYEGNIGYLIKKRLYEIDKSKSDEEKKVCPICGAKVSEDTAKYVLMFGPPDFRKKAMFDEIDCLGYFIANIKESKSKSLRKDIRKI